LIRAAVRRSDLEGHFDEPGSKGRERELLGMNDPRGARIALAAGRRRCRQRHTGQQRRRDHAEFHDVSPVGRRARDRASNDLASEIACWTDQNQDLPRFSVGGAADQADAAIASRFVGRRSDRSRRSVSNRCNNKPARS